MDAPLYSGIADAPPDGAAFWADTPDGKRLRFALWATGDRGTVLIFPGRTEYVEKYGRVVTQLARRGFSALVIDWRGQGLSSRPGNTTALGHVDDFAEYQSDIAAILAHPAATALPRPHVLLAHSMGGCIGLGALHRGLDVKAAIFSAPMWRLGLNPWVSPLARLLANAYCLVGKGLNHATGTGPALYVSDQPFAGNVLTNDAETWDWLRAQLAAHPELGLGGPSMGWIRAAFRETARLAALPAPEPVLTFLGAMESVVSPQGIRDQMAKPGAGRLVICPNAQHEILMESGAVKDQAWGEFDSWLTERGV